MATEKRFWTPCKHFKQCIGWCPYCLMEAKVVPPESGDKTMKEIEEVAKGDQRWA